MKEINKNFRVIFIGARIVGYRCLHALLDANINIVGAVTLDDKKKDVTTAFKTFSDLFESYTVPNKVFTKLNSPEIASWIRFRKPTLGIVVGVSQLISKDILEIPKMGFIGMHPTFLPEGRGRAPIPWALIKGMKSTGVSLFYCDAAADTGDILNQRRVPIYYEDTALTLGSRTDDIAIELLLENLPKLADGTAERIKQEESKATYWAKRTPEDGKINWGLRTREIFDWIRGLTHPYPGAFGILQGKKIYIWGARESLDERFGKPGEVIAILPSSVLVATGEGNILLTKLQFEGASEIDADKSELKISDQFEI